MKMHGKLSLLLMLALTGCGNQGGGSPTTVDTGTGQFIDSAVEGLGYQSGNILGLTSSDGSFQFEQALTIRFFIGDIMLGEGIPADVMSPLDIVAGSSDVSDDHVLNVARFLQTLDTDNDPTNGITISAFVRQQAMGKTVDFGVSTAEFGASGNVQVIVAELTASNNSGPQSLVSAAAAEAHLRESLGMEPMPEPVPDLSLAHLLELCRPPSGDILISIYTENGIIVEFNDSVLLAEANALVEYYELTWESHFPVDGGLKWGVVLVPGTRLLEGLQTFEVLCLVDRVDINFPDPVGGGGTVGIGDGVDGIFF